LILVWVNHRLYADGLKSVLNALCKWLMACIRRDVYPNRIRDRPIWANILPLYCVAYSGITPRPSFGKCSCQILGISLRCSGRIYNVWNGGSRSTRTECQLRRQAINIAVWNARLRSAIYGTTSSDHIRRAVATTLLFDLTAMFNVDRIVLRYWRNRRSLWPLRVRHGFNLRCRIRLLLRGCAIAVGCVGLS